MRDQTINKEGTAENGRRRRRVIPSPADNPRIDVNGDSWPECESAEAEAQQKTPTNDPAACAPA